VIGLAARFAGAADVEQYWRNLVDGVGSASPPEGERPEPVVGGRRFVRAVAKVADIEWFDADHFRVPSAEATIMDPQQRVLLEVASEALEDAGYAGTHNSVVGVFVGSGKNHYYREFVAPAEARAGRGDDVRITLANEKDFLAPRLAFKLGLTGPAVTVQTGCATALSAVTLACSALAAGDCDIALAGGVSLIMPDIDGYDYVDGGILSADGFCRAFDAESSGTVPGSGAGIVVLKRDTDARADRDSRRAVIRGWAINNDGGSRAGFTVPNVDGQEAVIRAALQRAGLAPDQVGYVEAHGTGTAIGDSVEFEALRRVFATDDRPRRSITLGAVKPSIGHTDAAAGIAGLIKAALAVERGVVPGTRHFRTPNDELGVASTPFLITAETRPWCGGGGSRIAGVSSFGLGGSNAHVVVASVAPVPSAPSSRPRQVLALSARTEDELQRMRERLADRLDAMMLADGTSLPDIAYTLAVGRTRFGCRWAAVVADPPDAVTQLRAPAHTGPSLSRRSLVISGTPGELAGMCTRLLTAEPMLRRELVQLTGRDDVSGLAAERAGALAAVAAVRVLMRVGLTFSRVDAPQWARPLADWFAAGAESAELTAALDACTGSTDQGTVRRGPGQVFVGPSFDLPEVLADAWRAGVAVDWASYYTDEPRSRVPLPNYPFTRQRFWLDRPEPPTGSAGAADAPVRTDPGSIIDHVERVWCDVLSVEHIPPDAHFIDDLGGDSLYAVEIGARLIQRLGLDLPIDLPFVAPTIASSAAFVQKTLATEADA
jgi:acyl transferase domain-containing protein